MSIRSKAFVHFRRSCRPVLHRASCDHRERKLTMKLRNLVAIAFLTCLPAGAQAGLMVMASGNTIGDQGIENASVSILGGDPSIVAIQSFQNGNVGAVHVEANLLGSGVATYGTLAASLQAQARNQATFPNLYEPSAFGILRISFEDGGTVASGTLPLGTPVVLMFVGSWGRLHSDRTRCRSQP